MCNSNKLNEKKVKVRRKYVVIDCRTTRPYESKNTSIESSHPSVNSPAPLNIDSLLCIGRDKSAINYTVYLHIHNISCDDRIIAILTAPFVHTVIFSISC